MSMYRAPLEAPRSGRVVHGPFPIRLGWLGLGVLFLAVAAIITAAALDDARLSCDRARDRCDYRGSRIIDRADRFALSELTGVRVEIETGSKGGRYGRPYLELGSPTGRATRPLALKQVSVAEAERFETAVEAELRRESPRFEVELAASRWMVLVGVLMLVAAVSLLRAALRRLGRVVMELRGSSLHVVRRVFGVPVWRDVVDVHGVTDVEVEWSRVKSFWNSRHSPGDPHGRLVLCAGDRRVPVTHLFFPAYHLHRKAEVELHRLLALPPRTVERERMLAAQAQMMAPAPVMGGGVGAAIGIAWLGLCCGSLAGIGILGGIFAVAGGLSDGLDTTVVARGGIGGALGGIALGFCLRHRAATR